MFDLLICVDKVAGGSIRTFQSYNSLTTSMASIISEDQSYRTGFRSDAGGETEPDEDYDALENAKSEITRLWTSPDSKGHFSRRMVISITTNLCIFVFSTQRLEIPKCSQKGEIFNKKAHILDNLYVLIPCTTCLPIIYYIYTYLLTLCTVFT